MHSVLIYTTDTCHFCHLAKDFFKQSNVNYTEVNLSEHPERTQEIIEKSGQMGVPVIDIDGQIIVGFDKKEIKQALELP